MLNNLVEQLRQLWARMDRRQRMIVAGGALAAVVGVGVMTAMMSTPDYKPLMTGLEPEDSQALVQQLATKKIDYKLSPDGKEVDVPASQLDQARMEVASQGAAHSGRMGFELFDKSSWGETEFDEKVNYQRALEGELERTIATLSNVKSARVHLVMPKDSVFLDRSLPAKASVALRLRRAGLAQDQVDAIARLVSGAVENLAPADVAIIDADTDEPLNRHDGTIQGHEIEEELTKRLLSTLGPVVGADNLRASVNVEYDPTSTEENEDRYDPAVSALLSTQRTREQSSDTAEGGVAGTSSNIPTTPGQGTVQAQDNGTDGGMQSSTSESSTFGVNKISRHTILPAGRIRRITAAILVNDYSDKKLVDGKMTGSTYKRSADQLKQLQALAVGVLGADSQRGDVITVENMTFSDSADSAEPGFAERVHAAAEEFSTPLRYAALLGMFVLAWALLFRPMQKQVGATLHQLSAEGRPAIALPEPGGAEGSTTEFDALLAPDTSAINLKRRLTEMVQSEPAKMAHTLQTWIEESEA